MKWILPVIAMTALLAGCATSQPEDAFIETKSPTGKLVRGELTPEQYLAAITAANKEARSNEQFELNKEPTRAFNTKTGRIEYVSEGSVQKWNEQAQRWEFTPID